LIALLTPTPEARPQSDLLQDRPESPIRRHAIPGQPASTRRSPGKAFQPGGPVPPGTGFERPRDDQETRTPYRLCGPSGTYTTTERGTGKDIYTACHREGPRLAGGIPEETE
jgi:hypothetical protein